MVAAKTSPTTPPPPKHEDDDDDGEVEVFGKVKNIKILPKTEYPKFFEESQSLLDDEDDKGTQLMLPLKRKIEDGGSDKTPKKYSKKK